MRPTVKRNALCSQHLENRNNKSHCDILYKQCGNELEPKPANLVYGESRSFQDRPVKWKSFFLVQDDIKVVCSYVKQLNMVKVIKVGGGWFCFWEL